MIRKVAATLALSLVCVATNQVFADQHMEGKKEARMEGNMGEMHQMMHPKFAECLAVELYTYSPKDAAHPEKEFKKTTPIPEGWTIIGGAGGDGHPVMVLCR